MLNHTLKEERCYDDDHIVVNSVFWNSSPPKRLRKTGEKKRNLLHLENVRLWQRKQTSISWEVKMNSKDLFANFAFEHIVHTWGRVQEVMHGSWGSWRMSVSTWRHEDGHYSQSEARSEQFEDRSEPANEKHMCFTRLSGSSQLICPWPTPFILSVFSPRSLSSLKQTGSSHLDNIEKHMESKTWHTFLGLCCSGFCTDQNKVWFWDQVTK